MALPSLHELAHDPARTTEQPVRTILDRGEAVGVRVRLRRTGAGLWLGALVFEPAGAPPRVTAEILRGASEAAVLESVRGLGSHHLKDLYRSLT